MPGVLGEWRRRPASGSEIQPWSCTWQMISSPVCQIQNVPPAAVCRSVFAVISPAAITRLVICSAAMSRAAPYLATRWRICRRLVS
jgi:hypothetical protein